MDEEEVTAEPWDDEEEEQEEDLSPEDLKAQLATERAAAAEAKAELEREREVIKKQKSGLDRSKTEWLANLGELGVARTEDGKFAFSDPQRTLGKIVGAPAAAQETTEELGNPWDDGYAQRLEAKLQGQLKAQLEERDRQWESRVQALTGMTLQTQQPAVEQAVAKTFERLGLADLHKEPEFQAFMSDALKQPGHDPLSLASPQYMAQLAATAIPLLPDEVIDRVKQRVEQRRSEDAALEGRRQARQEGRQMESSSSTRVTQERGGKPGGAELDLAGQLVEAAFENHRDSHYYDPDLNRAIGAGKAPELIEKRRKAGTRR